MNIMKNKYFIAAILIIGFSLFPQEANAQSWRHDLAQRRANYDTEYGCPPWRACHNALQNHRGMPNNLFGATTSLLGSVGAMPPKYGIYAHRELVLHSAPVYQTVAQNQYRPQNTQPQQLVYGQPERVIEQPVQALAPIRINGPCDMVPTGYVESNGEPVLAMLNPAECKGSVPAPPAAKYTVADNQQPIVIQLVMPTPAAAVLTVEEQPEEERSSALWFGRWFVILCLLPIIVIVTGYGLFQRWQQSGDEKLRERVRGHHDG